MGNMKFYLSSFRIGDEVDKLIEMTQNGNKKVLYISNALDYEMDLEFRNMIENNDINDLKELGFQVQLLDLRQYFGKTTELEELMQETDVIWIGGGNAFVLLQAMKLSGLDEIIKKLYESKAELLYGGYSAATYVLGPTLRGLHLIDDDSEMPYGEHHETIWQGLGILDYVIVPHYKSAHFESEAAEKAVQYLIDNKTLFIALRDGEVIIIE
jgi:dipeptidase E